MKKIHDITEKKFKVDNRDFSISMSIGAALYPNDAKTPESLLKCADEAMYQAKNSGKNQISFFQNDINVYVNNRLSSLKFINS